MNLNLSAFISQQVGGKRWCVARDTPKRRAKGYEAFLTQADFARMEADYVGGKLLEAEARVDELNRQLAAGATARERELADECECLRGDLADAARELKEANEAREQAERELKEADALTGAADERAGEAEHVIREALAMVACRRPPADVLATLEAASTGPKWSSVAEAQAAYEAARNGCAH